MANLCLKLLSQCIISDCNNPIFSGIESIGWIGNKNEWTFTYSETEPNVITTMTPKTYNAGEADEYDAVLYTVQQLGKTPFTGTTTSMVESNINNKFNNNFAFVVPDNSPTAAAVLDNIANGSYFAIVKNSYDGSDHRGSYQIFGAKKGMTATSIERDAYSEDNDGSYAVTLTENGSPLSAIFVEHKTENVVDTEEYLEGLTSEC